LRHLYRLFLSTLKLNVPGAMLLNWVPSLPEFGSLSAVCEGAEHGGLYRIAYPLELYAIAFAGYPKARQPFQLARETGAMLWILRDVPVRARRIAAPKQCRRILWAEIFERHCQERISKK